MESGALLWGAGEATYELILVDSGEVEVVRAATAREAEAVVARFGTGWSWVEQLLPGFGTLDPQARAELAWAAAVLAGDIGDDAAALAARQRLAPLLPGIQDPFCTRWPGWRWRGPCRSPAAASTALFSSRPVTASRRSTGTPPPMLAAIRSTRPSPPEHGSTPASSARAAASKPTDAITAPPVIPRPNSTAISRKSSR